MGAFERAEAELAAGRLWKARDRVTGALVMRPADAALLDLAARIYFAMGDLPRAGAYWSRTDVVGPDIDAATEAMHERYPSPDAVAQVLPRVRAGQARPCRPGRGMPLRRRPNPWRRTVAMGLTLAAAGIWCLGLASLIRLL